MKNVFQKLMLTAVCAICGLFASSSEAKADYYSWGSGYGYSYRSYYRPVAYRGYWYSGYSPYWTTSYYAPSYYSPSFVSYGPSSSCCAPACCDPCATLCCNPCGTCGVAGCATGNCSVPDRGTSKPPEPTPDNNVPKTFKDDPNAPNNYNSDGDRVPDDPGFRPTPGDRNPAPIGNIIDDPMDDFTNPTDGSDEPTERDAFKVIPQKDAEPMEAPSEETDPAETTPAEESPADESTTPEDEGKDVRESSPGETTPMPTAMRLDSKITWRVVPSRSRLQRRSTVGSLPIVRTTSSRVSNSGWIPVGHGTKIVRK